MKKFIVLAMVLAIFQNWNQIRNTFNPPPDFSAQHPEGVVLYSTTWCGYCKLAREFFKENKIAFVEYDIEASSEGRSQYNRLNRQGVPVVIIHNKIIGGYNPDEMKRLLNL